MRRLQIMLVTVTMAVAPLGAVAVAKQHKKSTPAAAAAKPDAAAPKTDGCMPDGSCCGACGAAAHDAQEKNAAAPAEAGGCPCQHMKKKTN